MVFLNKKGLDMVVATAIIMIISVVVLTALFILFKDNFSKFKDQTDALLDTSEGAAAKQACELACRAESKFNYCCNKHKVLGEEINCSDERLEVDCILTCEGFSCGDE